MKQLDPRSVWLFFISSIGYMLMSFLYLSLVIGVAYLVTVPEVTPDSGVESGASALTIQPGVIAVITLTSLVMILILMFIWAKLSYRFYKYELVEKGFRKESGVIWKRYVTIPYDRIQNVDIYRGLIARLLGLSDLHIHTAGVGGMALPEGRLPGLSREVAEQLRDELVDRSRATRSNQGL